MRELAGSAKPFDVDAIWHDADPPKEWHRLGPLDARREMTTMGGHAASISVHLGSDRFGAGDGLEFEPAPTASDGDRERETKFLILNPFTVPAPALAHPEELRCRVGVHVLPFAACRAWFDLSGSRSSP